jgi:hypothetical protein
MAVNFCSVTAQLAAVNELDSSIFKSSAATNSVHLASKITALASTTTASASRQQLELPASSGAKSGATSKIRLPSAEKTG